MAAEAMGGECVPETWRAVEWAYDTARDNVHRSDKDRVFCSRSGAAGVAGQRCTQNVRGGESGRVVTEPGGEASH